MVWFTLLIAYRVCINFYFNELKDKLYIFSAIMLIIMFGFVFWPIKTLMHKLRICFMIVLFKVIFPIGRNGVKFRDFLFADALSSFVLTFGNLTIAICLLYCNQCMQNHEQLNCTYNIAFPIMACLPYLFRFNQCVNKIIHKTSHKTQIINALKYITYIGYMLTTYFYWTKRASLYIYIMVTCYAMLFATGYDLVIDFNLLHWKSKNFLLRDKIKYPKWFYYYAMITNVFIRFIWFLGILALPIKKDFMLLMANILEIYRRVQWIIIRVENESLYNIEKYRNFLPIPSLPLH
jgi:hypothetical protein